MFTVTPQSAAVADAILKEVIGQDKAAEMLLSPPADATSLDATFEGTPEGRGAVEHKIKSRMELNTLYFFSARPGRKDWLCKSIHSLIGHRRENGILVHVVTFLCLHF